MLGSGRYRGGRGCFLFALLCLWSSWLDGWFVGGGEEGRVNGGGLERFSGEKYLCVASPGT
jgi:hypothetical protein